MNGGSVSVELAGLVDTLTRLPRECDDAERIDRIAALDALTSACAAARAVETTAFADSQRTQQEDEGIPARRLGRGIAEQIGYARKTSPSAAARYLTGCRTLTGDLPCTWRLLAAGQVSEPLAMMVAREVAVLERRDRRRLDADLAPDLPQMSYRATEAAVRRAVYHADPHAALGRAKTARADRGVSIRPAPDTMTRLTGFLPCEQGVAAWASLDRHARTLKSSGDERALAQIRADVMVERLTGQTPAEAVTAEIGLVMDPDTLLDQDDAPAQLAGYGPIPADIARHIAIRGNSDLGRAQTFIRRIFTDPIDETVATIDTRRRRFDGTLATLIAYRDQTCIDPYCDAPIRHLDHRIPHHTGGPTTAANGDGRCERGNHTKEMPHWRIEPDPDDPRAQNITTPTGHTYTTRPPPARGTGGNQHDISHRRVMRRIAYLKREQLIARLPSPSEDDEDP